MEGRPVAEEKNAAAPAAAPVDSGGNKGQKPTLFIILAILNMLIVGGVGAMLYLGKKKEAAEPKIEHVIKGEAETTHHEEATETQDFIGKIVPLETFIVNLAGSRGRKIAKVNMELELDGEKIAEEIEKRKPQIRDIIIILLSSKTFEEVSTREGKDFLRDEIRDTVNAFLTKGKIKKVYFTEFIYN